MKKLFLLITASALLAFASCNFNNVKGNGHVVDKTFTEKGFKDIDAGSVMQVHLKQGPEFSVRVEAEDNILALMKVYTEKEKLVIGFKDNTSVSPTKDIHVYITAPEYRNIDGSGACNVSSDGKLTGNVMAVELSGASNTRLDLDVNKLSIDASGASEIELQGKAAYFSVDASGSTSVKAYPLRADHVTIGISGSGDAEVSVLSSLKVDISGAGSVSYKGNPSSVQKDVSGAGSVDKVD